MPSKLSTNINKDSETRLIYYYVTAIKVDFFNCANIFVVVVLVRLPVLHCAVG